MRSCNFLLIYLALVSLSLLSTSCRHSHILHFHQFSIEVPVSWQKFEDDGFDSYVGGIITEKGDSLHFDLGWYSSKLIDEKSNMTQDTISNYKAIIVTPKTSGDGTTGIYIDSLWQAGSDNDRFQLNGQNLDPEIEAALIKAIYSLKFDHKVESN